MLSEWNHFAVQSGQQCRSGGQSEDRREIAVEKMFSWAQMAFTRPHHVVGRSRATVFSTLNPSSRNLDRSVGRLIPNSVAVWA